MNSREIQKTNDLIAAAFWAVRDKQWDRAKLLLHKAYPNANAMEVDEILEDLACDVEDADARVSPKV